MLLASIIVPIFNVDIYLKKCIKSILLQTINEYELILVDDGSNDLSAMLCDEMPSKDRRIVVIHKKNGGLSDARNIGLNYACGEYVYFVDGDDYVRDELIQKTVYLMQQGFDLVAFQYYFSYEDSRNEISKHFPGTTTISNNKEKLEFFIKILLQCKIGWQAWSRVYKREIIEKYKIRFADNKKIFAEDLYFSLCYCVFVNKLICIKDCLYYYRQRVNSIMDLQKNVNNSGRMDLLCKDLYHFYSLIDESKILVKHFSLIYLLVIKNSLDNYLIDSMKANYDIGKYSVRKIRRLLYKEIPDNGFMKVQMSAIQKERKLLYSLLHDPRFVEEILYKTNYIKNGNLIEFFIFKFGVGILNRFKVLDFMYRILYCE